jgi:TetR/AcrR family transcriptional regulator
MSSHTKRTRRKDARPTELLDAALDLFVEHGYAATRVEEVARQAGVSKGTLFLYFPSKEELFKAVVRRNIIELIGNWHNEFEEFTGNTADMVRYALRQWWEHVGATKLSGITRLVMNEASHFPEIAAFYQQEVIAPSHALLRRILQRGMERGEFRAVDPDYGMYGLMAPMLFLILWKHSMAPCTEAGSPIEPETFIHSQVEMLLQGLLSRA